MSESEKPEEKNASSTEQSGEHTIEAPKESEVRVSDLPLPPEEGEEEKNEEEVEKVRIHSGNDVEELISNMGVDVPQSDRPRFLASDLPPTGEANKIVFEKLQEFHNKDQRGEEEVSPDSEHPGPEPDDAA